MLSKAQASTPPQLRPPAIVPLRSAGEIHLIRSLWSRHVLQLDVRHPVTARGPPSLFEATLTAILDWVGEEGREAGDGGMRDAIAWLDIPMRERLMQLAAEQGRGWSVADVRAICAAQLDDWHDDLEVASHHSTEEDWDVADDDTGSLKTLDLTASRQAHQLLLSLFKAPNVVVSVNTLTSLNLSSTSLDLSALVPLLPIGLRHLSLADVTFLDQVTVREWRALGKRLQVLNVRRCPHSRPADHAAPRSLIHTTVSFFPISIATPAIGEVDVSPSTWRERLEFRTIPNNSGFGRKAGPGAESSCTGYETQALDRDLGRRAQLNESRRQVKELYCARCTCSYMAWSGSIGGKQPFAGSETVISAYELPHRSIFQGAKNMALIAKMRSVASPPASF